MSGHERLVENLLTSRPDLHRSDLSKLVEAKKSRVGDGYLTDQGALYLVASDLGVTLDRAGSDLSVKDLYIGASEITVLTRFLGSYPIGTFSRKSGEEGRYKRIIMFDGLHNAILTCWDDRTGIADELGLKTGDLIRVQKGYVRAGLDGNESLNLDENGSIENLRGDLELERKVLGLDSITKPISEIRSDDTHFAIKCILRTSSRISHFTRKDGSASSVHNLFVTDESSVSVRVVIWDPQEHLEGIPENSLVRIINLRSRISNRDELELHGDPSSCIEILGKGTVKHDPVRHDEELQLLSLGIVQEGSLGTKSISTLAIDREGKHRTIVAKGAALQAVARLSSGTAIRISLPNKALYAVVEDDADISLSDGASKLPEKEHFSKISTIHNGSTVVFTQGLTVTKTRMLDVTTRDGSIVNRAEVDIGDDTGEVTLVAWNSLSTLFDGLSPGKKLLARAFHLHETGERVVLHARSYSSIEIIP